MLSFCTHLHQQQPRTPSSVTTERDEVSYAHDIGVKREQEEEEEGKGGRRHPNKKDYS